MSRILFTLTLLALATSGGAQSHRLSKDLVKPNRDVPLIRDEVPSPPPGYMKPVQVDESEPTSTLPSRSPSKGGMWIGRPGAQPPPGLALDRRVPDNTMALKSLFEESFAAYQEKNTDALQRLGKQLVLPDPQGWFTQTFGSAKAAALTKEYEQVQGVVSRNFDGLIRNLVTKGQTQVAVVTLRTAGDPVANAHQRAALAAMESPVPLYSVRFMKTGTPGGYNVYSFAYVGGAFRFVGKMLAVNSSAETQAASDTESDSPMNSGNEAGAMGTTGISETPGTTLLPAPAEGGALPPGGMRIGPQYEPVNTN